MKPLARLLTILPPGRPRWLTGVIAVALVAGTVALVGHDQTPPPPRPAAALAPASATATAQSTPSATADPATRSAASGAAPTASAGSATAPAGAATASASSATAPAGAATASAGSTASGAAATASAGSATAPSGPGAPPKTVDVTGTIEPVQDESVSFAVAGTVAEIDVQPGQHVAAGAVLARLHASNLRSQLAQAQASLAQAQATLAGNAAKVGNDRLAVQQAQDTLNQDRADLATAQAAESLAAPVAGTVESVSATVGQSLAAGQSVLTIVPPGAPVEIHAQVAQQSDQAVHVGEGASANIPGANQTVGGRVTSVGTGTPATGSPASGPSAAGNSGEGTLEVTITVQNPPASLRDGMSAIVNIDTGGAPPVTQAEGSIQYADEWDVTAPQGGTLAQLSVKPGATVSKSQMLAQLSGANLDSALQRAQQTVRQGQDALAQAQATARSDSTAQAAADQANLASARATEQEAAANLRAATLTAPFPGTIGPVNLSLGEEVGGGGSTAATGSGSGDVELIGDAGFEVDVNVPDTQIGQVHPGAKAWVTPAGGAQPIQATVSQITPQATAATGSAPAAPTFPVTLLISAGQGEVVAGETAEVAIQPGG